MEAAGYGFAQQFATEAATMPGELLPPGDRTAPHRRHAYVRAIPSRVKEMVTVVTTVRLLTVAGMCQCVLPNSCPTVVGSCNRKYPFRICVNFSEKLPDGRRRL